MPRAPSCKIRSNVSPKTGGQLAERKAGMEPVLAKLAEQFGHQTGRNLALTRQRNFLAPLSEQSSYFAVSR